jgi:hypothetical protein
MISTDSAHIDVAFTLAFYSSSDSALTVTAEVVVAATGASTEVTLSKSSALSSAEQFVYVNSYTPSAEGWYFVQYLAKEGGIIRASAVSRFHAASATASSSGGSGQSSSGVTTSSDPETGNGTSVPTTVGGNAGTLTFSTRNV